MPRKAKPEKLLTQAAYARHRGKSRAYIGRLRKAGILVMRGRLVDVAASDLVLDDKARVAPALPMAEEPGAEGAAGETTYSEARRGREIYQGRLKRLEYETKSGSLIAADLVAARWTSIATMVRVKLEAIPSRVAPLAASLSDARQVRELLAKEIASALGSLAAEVRYGK